MDDSLFGLGCDQLYQQLCKVAAETPKARSKPFFPDKELQKINHDQNPAATWLAACFQKTVPLVCGANLTNLAAASSARECCACGLWDSSHFWMPVCTAGA